MVPPISFKAVGRTSGANGAFNKTAGARPLDLVKINTDKGIASLYSPLADQGRLASKFPRAARAVETHIGVQFSIAGQDPGAARYLFTVAPRHTHVHPVDAVPVLNDQALRSVREARRSGGWSPEMAQRLDDVAQFIGKDMKSPAWKAALDQPRGPNAFDADRAPVPVPPKPMDWVAYHAQKRAEDAAYIRLANPRSSPRPAQTRVPVREPIYDYDFIRSGKERDLRTGDRGDGFAFVSVSQK